jgi:DNA primase
LTSNSFNQQANKKHYGSFDGDAAGLRASVRGIDLIWKKECKGLYFPDGEDRTVLLRKHPMMI